MRLAAIGGRAVQERFGAKERDEPWEDRADATASPRVIARSMRMSSGSQRGVAVLPTSGSASPRSLRADFPSGSSGPGMSTAASVRAARPISTHADTPSSRICPLQRPAAVELDHPLVPGGRIGNLDGRHAIEEADERLVRPPGTGEPSPRPLPARPVLARPELRSGREAPEFGHCVEELKPLLERIGLDFEREIVPRASGLAAAGDRAFLSVVGRVLVRHPLVGRLVLAAVLAIAAPRADTRAANRRESATPRWRSLPATRRIGGRARPAPERATTSAVATPRTQRSHSASNEADGSSSGIVSPSESHVIRSAIAARYS